MANPPNLDLRYLDPVYLVKQTARLLRGPQHEASNVAPANVSAEVSISSSSLSSRELMLISGAAALGGAAVVAAVYAAPMFMETFHMECPVCKCRCCACIMSHQHPIEFLKKTLKGVSSALNAGRTRLLGGKPKNTTEEPPPSVVDDVEQTQADNNGTWTCVQVPREVGNTSVEVSGLTPDPYSPTKRKQYLSWDDYFMSIAFLSAQRSKDPIRQVGACLVGQDDIILGIGYNGFPRGCSDDRLPWAKLSNDRDILKTKYPYVCHAEMNAILNRNHASAAGQRLYTTMFPCNECAKLIIQAGITEVVFYMDKQAGAQPQFLASQKLLSMANVKVRQHKPKSKSIILEFQ